MDLKARFATRSLLIAMLFMASLACSSTSSSGDDGSADALEVTDADVAEAVEDTNNDEAGTACTPACGEDEECRDGECLSICVPECDADERCVDGECIPETPLCEKDEDCLDECGVLDSPCVICACGANGECAKKKLPDEEQCCEDDFDCEDFGFPDGYVCDTETGVCDWPPCDPDCAEGEHCDEGKCAPNVCAPECDDDCTCLVDGGDQCKCEGCDPECAANEICEKQGEGFACVEIKCEPECDAGFHCEIEDGAASCVENVCSPACPSGPDDDCTCLMDGGGADQCDCKGCDPACEIWQTCDGTECVELPCDPGCSLGTYCDKLECLACDCGECAPGTQCLCVTADDGACVPYDNCNPDCEDYEYCDDAVCTAYANCMPDCAQDQRCIDGDCVMNLCDPACTGTTICTPDLVCQDPCEYCDEEPEEQVCGLVDDGGAAAFVMYRNECAMLCVNAVDAACDDLPTQPVCDLPSYLEDPAGDHSYLNSCFAGCASVDTSQLAYGECSCETTCSEDAKNSGEVCGNDCVTYASECALSCADGDVLIQNPHECQPACGLCSPCDIEMFLDPVCGKDNTTYLSACEIMSCYPGEGLELDYHGECIEDTECPCQKPGVADKPVCASRPDTGWQTYATTCVANCLGADIYYDWICDAECDPTPEIPMCAYNYLSSSWDSLRNPCEFDALALIYDNLYAGECVCCGAGPGGCCDLSDEQPVCGDDGITYTNDCALQCAGITKAYDGECACPAEYVPVCGESTYEPGKLYTYGNECVAKSIYGVTTYTAGECAICATACIAAPGNPVCGQDGVSYPDICQYLKCNGDTIILGIDDTACSGSCPCN